MQHGEQKEWCEGRLMECCVYEENKFIEGKSWHFEGNIAEIVNQKESKKWDEEGNLTEYRLQIDKQKIVENYFKTGQIKSKKITYNREINSEYSEWNKKGTLIKTKQVKNEDKKKENKSIEKLKWELRVKKQINLVIILLNKNFMILEI